MEMCIRIWLLKILILIIYLPKIYGNVFSFGPDGPVALSEPIILICKINGFEGSADLNRNGALINSCSEVNFCSLGPSRNISNAVFKFEGNGLGIKVTIDPLLPDEVGMRYVCSFNSTDKEYNITISLETSTTFEYSSIIEPTSTPIFVESNTDISRISSTDGSQLNTLDIFPFSSDMSEKESLETIDSTNASFFKHTTSSVQNNLLSSLSLIQTLDLFKTSIQSSMIETLTKSPLNVTIESDYQSTSSNFDAVSHFSETTIVLLTSGVYMTTPEISTGLIYSVLDSSFSATTAVCPTTTFTETISTGMTSTETINTDMMSTETINTDMTSTETINTDMTSTETISTDMTSTETISTGMTSAETVSTSMPSPKTISEGMTSTETVNTGMTSTETISAGMTSIETESMGMAETIIAGMTSIETIRADMTSTDILNTSMTSSYKMFDIVSEVNETTSIASITDANVLTRDSLSRDIPVLQTTFNSFTTSGSQIRQSMESVITSAAMFNFFTSISEEAVYNPSFTIEALRSTNPVLTADEYGSQTSKFVYINTSDSKFSLRNSELSGTSSTIIIEKGDFNTTSMSYSSVVDTLKHTSDFVMNSHFKGKSVSVTQNSFLSSLTIRTSIQTSSERNNKAESSYNERYSSLPTRLLSSMSDKITETVSSTYDDKVILLTSSEQIILVTSSLNTLGSFTSGIKNSVLSTESFVKMVSRSSNEFATSSSSLDSFSPQYVKTTTPFQHGLSESSKDDIFISAVSGMIGAIIFVVLIAMFINRFIMNRNKSKDEKDDEISNQYGWSDDGGMNCYNKNYTSREYPFNSASSIHLPLPSYESPFFSYANNYKKNWYDNT